MVATICLNLFINKLLQEPIANTGALGKYVSRKTWFTNNLNRQQGQKCFLKIILFFKYILVILTYNECKRHNQGVSTFSYQFLLLQTLTIKLESRLIEVVYRIGVLFVWESLGFAYSFLLCREFIFWMFLEIILKHHNWVAILHFFSPFFN